jgi:hypothetical protein
VKVTEETVYRIVRDADGVPFLERVASCQCLGVLSGGVLEFPQTGFVFLGHRSGSHLDGTMKTSVVALGDLIENVDGRWNISWWMIEACRKAYPITR